MATLPARMSAAWGRARTVGELGWLLFLRDFRARFRQTFLGSMWAVGQALLSYVPLVLVGSQLGLSGGKDAKSYALHALLGLLIWQMFWDGLFSPQWIGRRMRGVLTEAAFPREAVLIAGSTYAAFNCAIYVVLMLATFLVTRTVPPPSFVLGVMTLPFVILAGVSLGVFIVPLTFIYLDFRYALPLAAPALMWTAPILYESPASGPLHWVNRMNPLTYLIDAPRDWLTSGWRLEEAAFPITVAVSFGLLALGLRFYRFAMPRAIECLSRR